MKETEEQSQKEMKKSLSPLIIIIVAIIVVGSIATLLFTSGVFKTKESTKNQETKEELQKEEENLDPPKEVPATNTEELKETVEKAEVKEITKGKIIFNKEAKVKKGEKVAVWVYSSPKFLGYFTVKEVNGEKVIEGLEEKLSALEIDAGNHNIAITTESGEPVGYVDIVIEETGSLKEEVKPIVKEITETKVIKFKTETKTNNKLAKGTQKTIQEGSNGEKEITYEVTYDAEGNEISRKKISEKTTKKAVNKIIEKGSADYSLSKDKLTGETNGFYCLASEKTEYGCDDSKSPLFEAIAINGQYYAKCLSGNCIIKTPTKITKSSLGYKGTINGKEYYFDSRAGAGGYSNPLTTEICNKYKFVCAD